MSAFYNVHDMCVFAADTIELKDGELMVSFWMDCCGDSEVGLAAIPEDPEKTKGVSLTPEQARTVAAQLIEAADRVERQAYPE